MQSILRFLVGQTSEPAFLASAVDENRDKELERRCEAYFYAGSKRLLDGDKSVAADYFEKCIGTGKKSFTEYGSALAELKTLKQVSK